MTGESLESIQFAFLILGLKNVLYNNKFQICLNLSEVEEANREKINTFFSGHFEEFNEKLEPEFKEILFEKYDNLNEKIEKILNFLKINIQYEEVNYIATKYLYYAEKHYVFAIKLRYNRAENNIEIYLKD